ncbi:hypothetical protein KZO83_07720 [Chromohalobacter sp. TMW 2.2308]|uniref:hypothetical protein n=1 Tax=Chromohalobacter TaxID=42054 RepID=UPI001FFDEB86|nr:MULTISPECIES: hypothetical protein [Chromohalobacter]MCK2042575.1 hypothetical protein [Chromohalobacter moromii]MCT8514907.1 hypothetical protein [Chromohalobacter sp. TMW 2.2271]
MKINMLAGPGPDYYKIIGDVITAYVGSESENYDLSVIEEGDTVTDVSSIGGIQPIHYATRENGELKVNLCQRVGPGYWSESGWFDASEYDPDAVHVVFDGSKAFWGTPVVYTRQGAITPEAS